MQRVGGFDVARGVAVALVVALHASLLPQFEATFVQPVSRMALVMLVSGVMAGPVIDRDAKYARSRVLDMIWLYLLWTPVTLLAGGGWIGCGDLVRQLVAPSSPLWYIGGLALLTAGVRVMRRVPPALTITVAGAAAAWETAGGRIGLLGYDQLLHFAVFFHIGLHGRERIVRLVSRCGGGMAVAAAVVAAALMRTGAPHGVVTIIAAAALLLIAQPASTSHLGGAFRWFGRHTLEVYLTHAPLLLIASRVVGPFGGAGLALLTAVVIATCLLLRVGADRIGLRWLYRRPDIDVSKMADWCLRGLRPSRPAGAQTAS